MLNHTRYKQPAYFALVVTLDAPESGLAIYEEVKQKLSIDNAQQVRANRTVVAN